MVGKERGHFPGQEQPDVGCPNGDRPRPFDARFLDTDDAVVGLGEAEKKPRPQRNVPRDDEKFLSSHPLRRTFDDPLPDPPTSHRPTRRRDRILAAALPPIGDPSIATRPGREMGASSSIFAITTPPRLCPTRCTRSPSVASTNSRRAPAACARPPRQERYRK